MALGLAIVIPALQSLIADSYKDGPRGAGFGLLSLIGAVGCRWYRWQYFGNNHGWKGLLGIARMACCIYDGRSCMLGSCLVLKSATVAITSNLVIRAWSIKCRRKKKNNCIVWLEIARRTF